MVTCISILQETEDPASDDDSGHTDSEGSVDSMDIVSRESTCTLIVSSTSRVSSKWGGRKLPLQSPQLPPQKKGRKGRERKRESEGGVSSSYILCNMGWNLTQEHVVVCN